MAKDTPATRIGGQISIVLRKPTKAADEPEGDDDREEGKLAADHAAELVEIEPGHGGERDDRGAERAEGHGRGIGDERQARCRERREAEADQHRRRDGDRRAESCGTFEKCAEGEGDEEELEAPVVADRADRALQNLELTLLARELVEKDDVENDPADGEQPEGRAVGGRHARHLQRHAVGEDCHGEGSGEAHQGRHVSAELENSDRTEQHEYGNCGYRRGKDHAAEGVVDLRPHATLTLPSTTLGGLRSMAN